MPMVHTHEVALYLPNGSENIYSHKDMYMYYVHCSGIMRIALKLEATQISTNW